MGNKLNTIRCRLEAQGYTGLSDETLVKVMPWGRLATGLCMALTAIATAFSSATLVWAIVPFSVLGFILPRHPFDLIYNYGIRHIIKAEALPKHGKPRRFACVVATLWLTGTGWAFYSGQTNLGYALGILFTLTAAVPTFTDFCVPSFFYGLMFGKPDVKVKAGA